MSQNQLQTSVARREHWSGALSDGRERKLLWLVMASLLVLVTGCDHVQERRDAYVLHDRGADVASTGCRIYHFSTDYALGENFPRTVSVSGNTSNRQTTRTGVEQTISTSEQDSSESSLLATALRGVLWGAAALALALCLLVYSLILEWGQGWKRVVYFLGWAAATGALGWVVFIHAPPWSLLVVQWLGLPSALLGLLLVADCDKRSRKAVGLVTGLLMLGAVVWAGQLSGETLVMDNATIDTVSVTVEDSRRGSSSITIEPKHFKRVRLPGREWTLTTVDSRGRLIERLSVSSDAGVMASIGHWFAVPGERCYNVGGENQYSMSHATYY